MKQGLGTQLRHLIELLDGAVQQAYADAGLDYRPFVAENGRWSYRCFACCPECGHAEEF